MGQLVDAMVPHCENTSPKEQEASARIFPFPAAAATKGRGRQSSACKQRNQGSLEVQGDMRRAFSQHPLMGMLEPHADKVKFNIST